MCNRLVRMFLVPNFPQGRAVKSFLGLLFLVYVIHGVSIWEPFCNEDKLYTPYVRVFQKGRSGAMLRDRGPGFIDLNGQKDIYVCTNGLVMMYYSKTTAMGEIFEAGELHWTPHHCELYNPSSNNGLKPDFPRKCLLSILLIGHPHDYRLPALQMFVAPTYDKKHGGYVNVTSLIMIGTDGECIIEKGAERARLRVRLDSERVINDTLNKVRAAAKNKRPMEFYPPMFCQLDAQRKLGQYEKGFVNLKVPKTAFVPFRKKGQDPLFLNTSFIGGGPGHNHGKETGVTIVPRFRTSEKYFYKTGPNETMSLGWIGDQVYAALLADRKMHFVGCLRYPEFSLEQAKIVEERRNEFDALDTNFENEFKNITPIKEGGLPFWSEKVTKVPWSKTKLEESAATSRAETFLKKYEFKPGADDCCAVTEKYGDLEKELADLKNKTAAAKTDNKTAEEISEAEMAEVKVQCDMILWPFAAVVSELFDYVKRAGKQLKTSWEDLHKALIPEKSSRKREVNKREESPKKAAECSGRVDFDPDNPICPGKRPPAGADPEVMVTMKPLTLAKHKMLLMQGLSENVYDRRLEPYNPVLVREHDMLLGNYSNFNAMLKVTTQLYGPVISNTETLTSRYKVYKGLLMKAHEDLMNAVKHIEHAGCSGGPYLTPKGDPFDRAYVDTMIEIADAINPEAVEFPWEEKDPEYQASKACNDLPKLTDTCKDIKPNTTRASLLLKNLKGKGQDFGTDDLWRQKVLDLIENIFMKVCPYISVDFSIAINRIIKGYLMGEPAGTGLYSPVNGTRLFSHDHNYQGQVYNSTYAKMAPNNWTEPPSGSFTPAAKLNPKVPFWDSILEALQHCDDNAVPMQFWHNEEGDKPTYVTFRKHFPNNNTEIHYDVDELQMQEKADHEFAFNWVIEMNWRIFSTVLGICMPKYEFKIPLITARFYALYSQDFLFPLRQIWMSNRDNPVFRQIMGNYYGSCKGDRWARTCMESAFVESGDRAYRPPRYLYVNAFTEMNYFTTGPMAGTSGMLGIVGSGNMS